MNPLFRPSPEFFTNKRLAHLKGEDMLLTKTVAQAERAWFERAKRVRERGRDRARPSRWEGR